MAEYEDDGEATVASTKPKIKQPPLYKVVLINDDYTPMDFVVMVLEKFFLMNKEQATKVMLNVHHQGVGVCGVYTKDIAETKVHQVNDYSRSNNHPLLCAMEEA